MIANPDFRTAKIMYCVFFDGRGPVNQILVTKGRTVTGNFYTNNCLLEVENHMTRRRPKTGAKGLRLLHDNARPHKKTAFNNRVLPDVLKTIDDGFLKINDYVCRLRIYTKIVYFPPHP